MSLGFIPNAVFCAGFFLRLQAVVPGNSSPCSLSSGRNDLGGSILVSFQAQAPGEDESLLCSTHEIQVVSDGSS